MAIVAAIHASFLACLFTFISEGEDPFVEILMRSCGMGIFLSIAGTLWPLSRLRNAGGSIYAFPTWFHVGIILIFLGVFVVEFA